jgi:hypothetical protein
VIRSVAILCPGPSLSQTWVARTQQYNLVIAVNRAILFERCDWWSAGDWTVVKEIAKRPSVGICSTSESTRVMTKEPGLQYVPWSDLPIPHPGFSMVAALALGAMLGAKSISVYGDDKTGDKDWDGTRAGVDRGAARWQRETALTRSACQKLLGLGIDVVFHQRVDA